MIVKFKMLYVETFPSKIRKVFDSPEDYYKFFDERFSEVSKELDIYNPLSKYNYQSWKFSKVRLNKDGTPRKYFGAEHLQTKESRTKQKIKWEEYKERQREQSRIKSEQKEKLDKETYDRAIDVLLKNNVDLNRLDIRVKR